MVHLQAQLTAAQAESTRLDLNLQDLDATTSATISEHQERIATLQQELIAAQSQSVSREYELNAELGTVRGELEGVRKECEGLEKRLEAKEREVVDVKEVLESVETALAQAKAVVAEREKELGDLRRAGVQAKFAADARHKQDQSTIQGLQQVGWWSWWGGTCWVEAAVCVPLLLCVVVRRKCVRGGQVKGEKGPGGVDRSPSCHQAHCHPLSRSICHTRPALSCSD